MEEVMAISGGGARVNTNISALNALNALNKVNAELGVHQIRLASGKRINSAADDASGYVISKKMEGRIRALTAADDNVGDASNLLSVAEGGYQTISDLLTQIKDKVTRFNNAGFGTSEQDALAQEINQLATEIDAVRAQTKFNGKTLLTGFSAGATVAGGTETKVGLSLVSNGHSATITTLDVSGAGASTMTFTSDGAGNVTLQKGTLSQTIAVGAAAQGASQTLNFSQLGVTMSAMGSSATTMTAAELGDAIALAANDNLVTSAGGNAAWQVGESSAETFTVSFSLNVDTSVMLGKAGNTLVASDITAGFSTNLDSAITNVLTELGKIGAQVNRLSAKSDMLTTSITNTEASKSRILDADIAKEQISAVKLQILQQTATAQLAQANQSPQVFLSLFR
jgi:flagellin